MAGATTYRANSKKEEVRIAVNACLAEMAQLHAENQQSQEQIEYLGRDIDTRFANIDAVLARLQAD